MTDAVLSSWLESEESRSAAQWHPLRVLALDPGGEADPGCDGQRAVAWGRVSHLALPLGERVCGRHGMQGDLGRRDLGGTQ